MTSASHQSDSRFANNRKHSISSSGYIVPDVHNPRTDTLMNSQAQPSSVNPSAFDTSSPGSLELNFPFAGSPHGSSNSGIDVPPDFRTTTTHGFANRGTLQYAPGRVSSPQHRASLASIDSAFDHDLFGTAALNQWTSTGPHNQAVDNVDDSPAKAASIVDLDGKTEKDDEKPPAWSELKTKAGKERKRLPLACIACRRKKIKCSGEKPACKHCLRARIPCVYKVTTRKAAPRTDYMAMLDKRLKRMEDRVIRVLPKDELPDFNATGRASVRPPLPGQGPKKDKDQPKKRSADEAFTQELNDWRNPKEKTTLFDPTAGLRKQREGENKLFIEGSDSLPPQHIQEHLAEVFFDCVYGQSYLLLHKPSFMRKLKAGTIPPVLILAVCAISARFSTHPQVSTEPAFLRGEQWATPARRIVEKRHYEPNITILTAMLMLGLHYFGTCEGGLSWSFGGQAMRMGYALQLHRELDHDPQGRNQIANDPSKKGPLDLSFTDREIRRRTMWACYLMDTFNSSGSERPSFLNEEYYQIQLPIKESHFQMEVPGPTEDLYGNVPMASTFSSSSSSAYLANATHPQSQQPPASSDSKTGSTAPPLDTTAANAAADIAAEARANMGVSAYIVRGVVLWKRIVKYLNLGGKEKDPHPIWDTLSQFAVLQRQITQLKSSLPPDLTYTPDNLAAHASERLANQFLFLHIILAQTSLFLHRFAIPTVPSPSRRPHHAAYIAAGMPRSFLSNSANAVVESASTISKLIADSAGHTLTVPFAGYCAYAAATVHVWGIFSKNAALEASSKENLRHNYKYLTRMKRYWGMFHYMAESIKDNYRAFADAAIRSTGGPRSAGGVLLRNQPSNTTNGHDAGIPMDLDLATSGPPSRAETPGAEARRAAAAAGGGGGPAAAQQGSANGSGGGVGGKAMFQYGDWFDKYPHGVSESEWENSHLEYRREAGTAEAVMSQRSELQSVEEFFASLSPPSKADDGPGGQRGKKIARRRGKSVAENKKDAKGAGKNATAAGSSSIATPTNSAATASAAAGAPISSTSNAGLAAQAQQQQQVRPRLSSNATEVNISQPFNPADFDIASPSLYQTPQIGGQSQPTTQQGHVDPFGFDNLPHISFNWINTLPAIDRQMVFGAYSGVDPSSETTHQQSAGLDRLDDNSTTMDTYGGNANPWEQLDLNGYGYNDPLVGGNNMMDTGSSAWLLPFNIEPPNYGSGGMEDFGNTALDGMDFGDMTAAAGGIGSDSGSQYPDQKPGA
ncbi:hypothetical protein PV08_06071 [Exophiala spinifera]|uniref:Zn(2)-C6 fungal-type domain-containing protein n=1 Tax=Exophiala spinifera TaxID=91928 RepID=A0A0D2BBR1_9EURO|nr:uncharacterized protein PV08_06071 [Exophiala spinifera]KIW16020.1 hypothetical protein PV08_06071 [Exophiala spinifera]